MPIKIAPYIVRHEDIEEERKVQRLTKSFDLNTYGKLSTKIDEELENNTPLITGIIFEYKLLYETVQLIVFRLFGLINRYLEITSQDISFCITEQKYIGK